ncbi:TPA: hypothetical protein ACINMU_001795 [Streptococcus agalactiae]
MTVKVIGDSSFGHIISVADTKGHVKGYIQNTGVDIKKRSQVKFWLALLWGMVIL